MANPILNPRGANLGGSDSRANNLAKYRGILESVWLEDLPSTAYAMRATAVDTDTYEFYGVGVMEAHEHTPGTDVEGQNKPARERRTVVADQKELTSGHYEARIDRILSHIDVTKRVARNQMHAIKLQHEIRVLRQIAQGARQAAREDAAGDPAFPAGNLIQRNAASTAAAYPMTAQGSKNLQTDLEAAQLELDTKNVPPGMRVAFLGPREWQVLMQDRGLSNAQLRAPLGNSVLQYQMVEAAGFNIVKNNILNRAFPSTAVTTGEAAYQGNFTKTAWLAMGHNEAVGLVSFGGLDMLSETIPHKGNVTFLSPIELIGCKWLTPEACVEGYVSTSEYTLTNGVYAPAA
jgi:hypothetical protein